MVFLTRVSVGGFWGLHWAYMGDYAVPYWGLYRAEEIMGFFLEDYLSRANIGIMLRNWQVNVSEAVLGRRLESLL